MLISQMLKGFFLKYELFTLFIGLLWLIIKQNGAKKSDWIDPASMPKMEPNMCKDYSHEIFLYYMQKGTIVDLLLHLFLELASEQRFFINS